MKKKVVMVIPALCLAFNASAGCPVDHPRELPVIPNGATASKVQMYEAQLAADTYLLQAKTYLDCGVMNRRQHNALLGQLEMVTESYDKELVEFQVRTNMVAEK